jgi:hypothetical protein
MKTVSVLERVLLLIVCGLMSFGLMSWLSHSFGQTTIFASGIMFMQSIIVFEQFLQLE